MNARELFEGLMQAELTLAHFNAMRTTPAESDVAIQRITTESFEYLLEPARPTSTYYNRAVARSSESFAAEALSTLRDDVAGIEVLPNQLDAGAAERLVARGFVPAYQLCYLGAVVGARLPVERDVVRLLPSQTDLFFDLLQLEGVDFPAARRAVKRRYYCTDQFQAYVARDADGSPCGWTTMHVDGSTAFFGNSFTLPRHRQLGVHSALLAARLNAAAESGVRVAYTDVEHGSQSHYNCERAGFRTLAVNTVWARRR